MWSANILPKENLQRLITKGGVPDYIVRFETRGKEFASVARLTKVASAKAKIPQLARGLGVKAP